MSTTIRLESQHDLAFPRAAVWPALSQTDWINRAIGLPPVEYDIQPRGEGGSAVTARAKLLGWEMRWQERPFEWLMPEFYRVHRTFANGPFLEARMGIDLHEQSGGTRAVVYSEIVPRHALGRWIAQWALGPKTARDMRRIMTHTQEFLRGRAPVALPRLPVHPVNETALRSGMEKLQQSGPAPELTQRLEKFLRTAPDVELTHIRPFAVARRWQRDQWAVLGLFLHATRCGLLDLSWEILCPNCRSSRQPPADSLGQLKRESHCEVCQIRFDAEFDQSVELKFAVNPGIRPRDTQTFCLAGPGGKPHIVSQLLLEANETRLWKMPELTRSLRLRSPQVKEPLKLQSEEVNAPGRLIVTCRPEGFQLSRRSDQAASGTAEMVNPNRFPVVLSWEQMVWSDDILTAARVTNCQEFRDLFAREVISPTEQITVGAQVVLFTDLRGSTAMYRDQGDAPAYALVRNHFAVLMVAVRAQHGTVVKTLGDAVMATFSRVDEALAAVRQMHRELPAANPGLTAPLRLKSSLHVGPCLAVNANDRLDFFGSTINLAARMVECCHGGDLTVSDELFHLPEMDAFLQHVVGAPESAEVHFRGFEVPRRVWRVVMV